MGFIRGYCTVFYCYQIEAISLFINYYIGNITVF